MRVINGQKSSRRFAIAIFNGPFNQKRPALSSFFAEGIDFAPKAKAVERAQSVCEFFGEGMSSAKVYEKIFQGSAFSERQTAIFMADAVQTYCPQYADQFIR